MSQVNDQDPTNARPLSSSAGMGNLAEHNQRQQLPPCPSCREGVQWAPFLSATFQHGEGDCGLSCDGRLRHATPTLLSLSPLMIMEIHLSPFLSSGRVEWVSFDGGRVAPSQDNQPTLPTYTPAQRKGEKPAPSSLQDPTVGKESIVCFVMEGCSVLLITQRAFPRLSFPGCC